MESNSADELSDDGLQIVLDTPSPRPKKRTKKELDEADRQIIACVEKDIEENLEEKATKTNLTAQNVKNIIRQVVTNEHVLALLRHAENPEENSEPITVYEPKYTRAKTKLMMSNTQSVIPWAPPPESPSEVHMLFSEELQEDSSGDEYVPEALDQSLTDSVLDTSQTMSKEEEEQANIARRTRSKLSLSHKPLEEIEGAFMPPDITTDMYDMDCDDEVWKEFLKTFTKPLDEVNKAVEDEDHDPEYNILADEEIDEVDKEELRADRAVTVSRKEFNCLMAELFEFADMYDESNRVNEKSSPGECDTLSLENDEQTPVESDSENDPNISIKKCQIPLLTQQLRQHVQMLTQNFLLTYEHPEYSDMAVKYKEMLWDLKSRSEEKYVSTFHIVNLDPALKLIEDWENIFLSKNKEVQETKKHVEKVIAESIEAKLAGRDYVVTFPPLLMETISKSEVFIYPNLLPRIPFKSSNVTRSPYYSFTHSEENLIALFLEQAIPLLKQDSHHLTKFKKVNLEHISFYLNKYFMSSVPTHKITRYIKKMRNPQAEENPIKFYYRNKKAPPTVHYVVPLDLKNLIPPCKRSPESLPYQWQKFLFPEYQSETSKRYNNCYNQVIVVSSPIKLLPVQNLPLSSSSYNIDFAKKIIAKRKLQPNGPLPPLPAKPISRKQRSRIRQTSAFKKTVNTATVNKAPNIMLPDMPSLGGTPVKNQNVEAIETVAANSEVNAATTKEQELTFQNIATSSFQYYKPENTAQVRQTLTFEGICELACGSSTTSSTVVEKDNPDDINELMIASCTVKNVTKKEPSGAEKKRAKIRREFMANLVMATPNPPDKQTEKEEGFADAFYDKLKQTLTLEEYDKLMDILGHYDESNGEFVDLFKNVQAVLSPKYKELSDEFLLFMTDIQAHKVGELMPYFMMKDMDRFMKKLQVYFKDQPSHLRKILKSLTDLSENADIDIETVKSSILPMFKGNAALTDWFLQLFPSERLPNLLSAGQYEVMDITKELSRQPNEDIYETVVLPDMEDPYGGTNCICQCHNVESPQFKSRTQHCVKCGLKFIQGKIYIQTGKGLRPAVVSFVTNPEKDHTKRLSATTQRKRSDTSPSKQATSPNKENQTHEEARNSNESEEDIDGKKKKAQRKRKIKHKDKPNSKETGKAVNKVIEKVKTDNPKPSKTAAKKPTRKRNNSGKRAAEVELKPGSTSGQQKRPAEEHSEVECGGSADYVELKVSSEHSGESETEFFESPQDVTNTDSDESTSPSHTSQQNGTKRPIWTREEDKIILQAFRQRNDSEETLKHISEVLQNRTVVEIKNRFHKLMVLLQQMASNS